MLYEQLNLFEHYLLYEVCMSINLGPRLFVHEPLN